MTEAVTLATAHAFENRGIIRMEAGVYPCNRASMRVLEKAGYNNPANPGVEAGIQVCGRIPSFDVPVADHSQERKPGWHPACMAGAPCTRLSPPARPPRTCCRRSPSSANPAVTFFSRKGAVPMTVIAFLSDPKIVSRTAQG
ncbi:MAG: GNAT family N-acetyltransferase [Deltaproteobacteria bacterium]|nr:GNAT family N-acetyltransferase [Deltaproteobacteria bacterium]